MIETGILDKKLKSLITENFKELSSVEGNLLSVARGKDVKTFFITSCHPSEGKTVSAISMAYALATQAKTRVLLIDGNFHSPKIHELFSVNIVPGLSDLLLSNFDFSGLMKKTEYENLMIMSNGTDLSDKLNFFELGMLKDKLDPLRQRFDYIIVDGYSVFGSLDPSHIIKYFDGIIFVVECEKTRWEVLQQAKEKINNVGGNIVGAVLNKRKYYIPKKLYGKI